MVKRVSFSIPCLIYIAAADHASQGSMPVAKQFQASGECLKSYRTGGWVRLGKFGELALTSSSPNAALAAKLARRSAKGATPLPLFNASRSARKKHFSATCAGSLCSPKVLKLPYPYAPIAFFLLCYLSADPAIPLNSIWLYLSAFL